MKDVSQKCFAGFNDVVVSIKDMSYLQIHCDNPGIYSEIYERFSFFAEGYRFQEKFKRKIWDGKIRLFDNRNHTLPFGLYPDLRKWAKTSGYNVVERSEIMPSIPLTEDELLDFCMNDLKLPFEPRDYQLSAAMEALRVGRRTILSPTGSGKSLILFIILEYLQRKMEFQNILVLVPTVGLVTQLKADFVDYAQNDESFDSDNILLVPNAKKVKWDPAKNVTITTWQSMMSELKGQNPKEFFAKYEALVVDEAHTMAGTVAREIAVACSSTPVKIGMTGTLSNTKTGELAIRGLFGPAYVTTTTADLIEDGTLSQVIIKAIQIDHEGFDIGMDYQQENLYVRNCEARNEFIARLADKVSKTGNTLILYQNLDQGDWLFDRLRQTEHTVFKVNGSTDAEAREEARQYAENHDGVLIVASFQTFSTGINIKNLHNLVLASPTKSMIRLLQSIGRALRKHHSKDCAVVYDIYDRIAYPQKSKKNFGLVHFAERYKIYSNAKLEIDIIQGPKVQVE